VVLALAGKYDVPNMTVFQFRSYLANTNGQIVMQGEYAAKKVVSLREESEIDEFV
jgi:uncharacterized protein YegP (UPF0339 family)